MSLKIIYIARHGYRSNWLPEPHPEPPTGINGDFPLAKHGEDQAKELAHYILSITPQPEIIFSSPFYRCLQTSTPIAQVLDIEILLENGIGEWYKPSSPVIPKPASYEVLSKDFDKLKDDWKPILYPSSKGESEDDIFIRCQTFIKDFIPKFEEKFPKVQSILLVTHAATKIALGLSLLGLNGVHDNLDDYGTRLRAGVCSLDRYEKKLNLGEGNEVYNWSISMNGNCEFLTDGEEMHWDFQNGFGSVSIEDFNANEKDERRNIDGLLIKEDVQEY